MTSANKIRINKKWDKLKNSQLELAYKVGKYIANNYK